MERHNGENVEIDIEFSMEIPILGTFYLNCLQKTNQNCFLVGTDWNIVLYGSVYASNYKNFYLYIKQILKRFFASI